MYLCGLCIKQLLGVVGVIVFHVCLGDDVLETGVNEVHCPQYSIYVNLRVIQAFKAQWLILTKCAFRPHRLQRFNKHEGLISELNGLFQLSLASGPGIDFTSSVNLDFRKLIT